MFPSCCCSTLIREENDCLCSSEAVIVKSVTARALFYVYSRPPRRCTSRSSPIPFSIGVIAFRGNRTHVPGDKYMSNPFPLPIELPAGCHPWMLLFSTSSYET
ncbi:hypothetical protein QL285_026858 [Trifolium repens]|nr:hypothetical protein QL285_026858 [Trifolium repens]